MTNEKTIEIEFDRSEYTFLVGNRIYFVVFHPRTRAIQIKTRLVGQIQIELCRVSMVDELCNSKRLPFPLRIPEVFVKVLNSDLAKDILEIYLTDVDKAQAN